jgi:hypothetical protein
MSRGLVKSVSNVLRASFRIITGGDMVGMLMREGLCIYRGADKG